MIHHWNTHNRSNSKITSHLHDVATDGSGWRWTLTASNKSPDSKAAWNDAEGVFKVTAPRNDVTITVDGWTMPPFMGLTSGRRSSRGKDGEAMVMGDMVLFQDEVNPVMSAP